jgi:DNA-binding CsgD family transcriptional regulator
MIKHGVHFTMDTNGERKILKKLAPLYRFGWAFLLAWVFSVFYTQVVGGYTGSTVAIESGYGFPTRLFFLSLPVFFSVLTLFFIVKFEKRLGSPINRPQMLWAAPLITAVSCPLLFIQSSNLNVTMLLFAIGAIGVGVGSGLLWVMWGEYYAKISQEDVEFLAPISAAGAAVLVLLVSSMSGFMAVLVVMCFPLISGYCLFQSWRDVQQQDATAEYLGESEQKAFESVRAHALSHPWAALRVMSRTGFGIMIACLFVCLLGSFWRHIEEVLWQFQIAIVTSILFMSIISLLSSRGPQRVSVSFLFRWMCPLLVVGFVALILWGSSWGSYIAFLISIAARFSFCLITQMFFAHYATTGRITAVQAYGFGWIFVHLGDFLGVLSLAVLNSVMEANMVSPYEISAISIALFTALTMFVLNKAESFSFQVQTDAKAQTGEVKCEEKVHAHDNRGDGGTGGIESKVRIIARNKKLTPREAEVFGLLARGRSVPFIRDSLVVSRDTAATHVKHIYAKLEVHSRQELIDLIQNKSEKAPI